MALQGAALERQERRLHQGATQISLKDGTGGLVHGLGGGGSACLQRSVDRAKSLPLHSVRFRAQSESGGVEAADSSGSDEDDHWSGAEDFRAVTESVGVLGALPEESADAEGDTSASETPRRDRSQIQHRQAWGERQSAPLIVQGQPLVDAGNSQLALVGAVDEDDSEPQPQEERASFDRRLLAYCSDRLDSVLDREDRLKKIERAEAAADGRGVDLLESADPLALMAKPNPQSPLRQVGISPITQAVIHRQAEFARAAIGRLANDLRVQEDVLDREMVQAGRVEVEGSHNAAAPDYDGDRDDPVAKVLDEHRRLSAELVLARS